VFDMATRTKMHFRHASRSLGPVEILLIVGMLLLMVFLVWWWPWALR